MQHGSRRIVLLLGLAAFAAVVGGCKKNVSSTPPWPAQYLAAAEPTVTLNALPATVNPGEAVTLSWTSTNATDLDIQPAIGSVAPQGTRGVNPTQSTTYTITATGAGGSATATAQVNVNTAPAAQPAGQQGRATCSARTSKTYTLTRTNPISAARLGRPDQGCRILPVLPAGARLDRRRLR